MKKAVLVVFGFVSGFLLAKFLHTLDAMSLYLAYRINGPRAIHFIEDLFAYQPGIAFSFLAFISFFVYLVVENAHLETEIEEEKRKACFQKDNLDPP